MLQSQNKRRGEKRQRNTVYHLRLLKDLWNLICEIFSSFPSLCVTQTEQSETWWGTTEGFFACPGVHLSSKTVSSEKDFPALDSQYRLYVLTWWAFLTYKEQRSKEINAWASWLQWGKSLICKLVRVAAYYLLTACSRHSLIAVITSNGKSTAAHGKVLWSSFLKLFISIKTFSNSWETKQNPQK